MDYVWNAIIMKNMNKEEVMWTDNDDLKDYRKGILENFVESVAKGVMLGGAIGEILGSCIGLGGVGRIAGSVVGAGLGITRSLVGGFVDFLSGIFW